MRAILLKAHGSVENMYIGDYPTPHPKPEEILIKVHATALNRADVLQRQGKYPPPKGASPIMGLEVAGEIVAVGNTVKTRKAGEKVCGLLSGGGYAEYATLHHKLALPIPKGLAYEQAAAIPEVFLTAFQAIDWIAALQPKERILIHAGASGVGTAAIQIANAIGATVYATASKGKHATCLNLGATKVIDYKTEQFDEVILSLTKGQGVNVVIDFIAAPYLQKNLNILSMDGRLVLLSLLGGIKTDSLNIVNIIRKRLQITGSTLRARSLDYKIKLSKALQAFAWSLFESQQFKPIIDSVYDWEDVRAAHTKMEHNRNKGKIVLRIAQ